MGERNTCDNFFPKKMTKLTIISIFVCLVVICKVLVADAADEKYSNKYDQIDVDAVLANSRLRNQYVGCLLNTSPCSTGAARFLKENFAEAFFTKCKKCTDRQIYFFNTVVEWFMKNEPETWSRAVQIAIKELRSKNA